MGKLEKKGIFDLAKVTVSANRVLIACVDVGNKWWALVGVVTLERQLVWMAGRFWSIGQGCKIWDP